MYKSIVDVEGMMCGHCEAHVSKAVSNAFNVKSVAASHESGKVEIISETGLDSEKLKSVIEAEEYKVLDIKAETC